MSTGLYSGLPSGVPDDKPRIDWRSEIDPSVYKVTIGGWNISSTPNHAENSHRDLTAFQIKSPGRSFTLSYGENGWEGVYRDTENKIRQKYTLITEPPLPREIAPFIQKAHGAVEYIAKEDEKNGLSSKPIPGLKELQQLNTLAATTLGDPAPAANAPRNPPAGILSNQVPNKPRSQFPSHPA